MGKFIARGELLVPGLSVMVVEEDDVGEGVVVVDYVG